MATRAIYVRLTTAEVEALKHLGRQEDRDPRQQAARFVREGLRQAGVLQPLLDPANEQPVKMPR